MVFNRIIYYKKIKMKTHLLYDLFLIPDYIMVLFTIILLSITVLILLVYAVLPQTKIVGQWALILFLILKKINLS